MKLFFWKDNFMIDNFAKQLADDCFGSTPPPLLSAYFDPPVDAEKTKKSNAQRDATERRLYDMALKVVQFKQQMKLGIYGKARLLMTFQERLVELGYEQTQAERLGRHLLRRTA